MIKSVLVIATPSKGAKRLKEVLAGNGYKELTSAANCTEARQMLIKRRFDLCVVVAPLDDEFGDEFAAMPGENVGQVMLLVRSEVFDEVSARMDECGVMTVAMPIDAGVFSSVLKLANAAVSKIVRLRDENERLQKKVDEMRLISRAKCVLVAYLGMTEEQAHRYLEKQAMDMRVSKKEMAIRILKTYEG